MAEPDVHNHAFIVKRATGEIHITAAHPRRLREAMVDHVGEYDFDAPIKHHDELHSAMGRLKVSA